MFKEELEKIANLIDGKPMLVKAIANHTAPIISDHIEGKIDTESVKYFLNGLYDALEKRINQIKNK